MLQPSNRLTLLDAMRPPEGFAFDAAMAVTFTLDLRALLAAPAAFVLGAGRGVTNDKSGYEPIELLHAVRAHAGKFTILSQVGEIALPPSRRVFAFLERAIVPVRAPLGGVVHPKVWVLRYEREGEERLRVLIASRNLTFDASWDTIIRLDEADDGRADLAPLAELYEALLQRAVLDVESSHQQRVASLAADLRQVRFALPPYVDGARLTVLGIRRTPSPLPKQADRSLILSPFVGDDFFTKVRPGEISALVSRPEQLDRLSSAALHGVEEIYAFDDGSAIDHAAVERRSELDPGRPIVGLHAKVFAFEEGRRAQVFLGSANATGEAFTRNVEVLLELTGRVDRLGIDRLSAGTTDECGLETLLIPYEPHSEGLDEAPDDDPHGLDGARRQIADLAIEGVVERDGDEWAVTYRTAASLPSLEETTITCWPLPTPGDRHVAPAHRVLDERFPATLATISGLLAFELEHESGILTAFVVPVPLRGVPEQRDRALLRALIADAERFLRYLLALLDEGQERMELLDAVEAPGLEGSRDRNGGVTLPVLEKMLSTLRRDPAKLIALDPLVTDLAADDALPAGFNALWMTLRSVVLEEANLER